MIKWYNNNCVTANKTWSYETLVYSTSAVETILYNIAMYRKTRHKSTYISICGYDGKAVAGIRVEDYDLYKVNNVSYICKLVFYANVYKIRISSFGTISIIPV